MAGKRTGKPAPLDFGPLPVGTINKTLGTDLIDGHVVMSGNAQVHASRRHPDEYPMTMPHVASVIQNPLYIGDDARNPGKIELISRIPALGTGLLVAVEITLDRNGTYNVVSFYPVSDAKIQRRREKGFLVNARK